MEPRLPTLLIVLSFVTIGLAPAATAAGTEAPLPTYHVAHGEEGITVWEETNGVDGLQTEPAYGDDGEQLYPADEEVTVVTTEDHAIPVCIRLGPDGKADEVCLAVIYPPHVPSVCFRLGPDGKAEEICVSDLIQ